MEIVNDNAKIVNLIPEVLEKQSAITNEQMAKTLHEIDGKISLLSIKEETKKEELPDSNKKIGGAQRPSLPVFGASCLLMDKG
jgi:hypothetical protein